MRWYTKEQLQELADKTGRPQFGWRPIELADEEPIRWIRDITGGVKNFSNPNDGCKDTDPWQDKRTLKIMRRPQKW